MPVHTFKFDLNAIHVVALALAQLYGAEAEVEARFGRLGFDLGISMLKSSIGQFYATDPRGLTFTPCDPPVASQTLAGTPHPATGWRTPTRRSP